MQWRDATVNIYHSDFEQVVFEGWVDEPGQQYGNIDGNVAIDDIRVMEKGCIDERELYGV